MQSELVSRRGALRALSEGVRSLQVRSPSQANRKLAGRLLETEGRLESANRNCRAWGENLADALGRLRPFVGASAKFDEWLYPTAEELAKADLFNKQPPETVSTQGGTKKHYTATFHVANCFVTSQFS